MSSNSKKLSLSLIVFFLVSILSFQSEAHEPDHAYLYLRVHKNELKGRLEVTAADINKLLGTNLNEEMIEEEVSAVFPRLKQILSEKISFGSPDQVFPVSFNEFKVLNLKKESDVTELHFTLQNLDQTPDILKIEYNPFFDVNDNHKGVLIFEYNWKAGIIANYSNIADIFTNTNRSVAIDLSDNSIFTGFWAMIKLGVWHIWIGLDHILFLVALVLPAVVRRKNQNDGIEVTSYQDHTSQWSPVAKFKPAALYILKIVTFFTIAHSITLAIASLDIVNIPSRYVESIIAFSIAIAAFHNIKPIFNGKEWIVAFAFGLFHGFGFASVLGEKGLGGDYMILSLLGFNIGVELGQIAIILLVFPILFILRKSKFYPTLLTVGSVLLILISLHWSIERLFDFTIPIVRWVSNIFA